MSKRFYASPYTTKPICLSEKQCASFLSKQARNDKAYAELDMKLQKALTNDKVPPTALIKMFDQLAELVDARYNLIVKFDETNTITHYRNVLKKHGYSDKIGWLQ